MHSFFFITCSYDFIDILFKCFDFFFKHLFIFISVCWMATIDCFQATNSQTRSFRLSTGRQTCMKNIAMVANHNMGLGSAVFSICYTSIFVNAFFLCVQHSSAPRVVICKCFHVLYLLHFFSFCILVTTQTG